MLPNWTEPLVGGCSLRSRGPLIRKPLSVAAAFVALGCIGRVWSSELPCLRITSDLAARDDQVESRRPGAENLGMAMAAASLFIAVALVVVWVISLEGRTQRQER